MSFQVQLFIPAAVALAVALAGPAIASPSGLNLPPATLPMEPAQPISFPDLRLQSAQAMDTDGSNAEVADLRAPCRDYADQPSTQPDAGFAECWNEKKTAWGLTKPSAIGLSQPQMNSPLSSGSINGGAPRETPVP